MSGRCLLRLTRMSSMSKYQESCLRVGQTLFIEPLKQKSHWLSVWALPEATGRTGQCDWTHLTQLSVARSSPRVLVLNLVH
jgi:hypothetical protein